MTKEQLVSLTAKAAKTTRRNAAAVLNAALAVSTEELTRGGEIKLAGFGTLAVHEKQVRGRDFHTGEVLPTKTVRYIRFDPCSSIKALLKDDGVKVKGDDQE